MYKTKLYFLPLLMLSHVVFAQLVDHRYCHTKETVVRDSKGDIARSQKVMSDFQKLHPCPSTGKTTGACKNWSKDHVIPLACGGCDSVENMQWLPNKIKTCADDYCKDRFERIYYCN